MPATPTLIDPHQLRTGWNERQVSHENLVAFLNELEQRLFVVHTAVHIIPAPYVGGLPVYTVLFYYGLTPRSP